MEDIQMSTNFITIEGVTGDAKDKVKQSLRFRTGKFVWRIKFTAPLNPKTVNNQNLYVTHLNQTPLKTKITYNTVDNYIEVEPLEAYGKEESYLLHVSRNVMSKGGQKLSNNITIQFKV